MEQVDQPAGRLMQVKVLYTFNDDPKSNCLARCPQPLHIQTAQLDSTSEIGVIELRTCIQAIAAASPELVAKLGQDYTVYAYDYSEYETPLVGQGMLSYILASNSSTPTAPAHQSRTLVTGKVSKNLFGLFSRGATETLEVKLKLIPVPSSMQSAYLEGMEKYRSPDVLGGAMSQSLNVGTWQSLVAAAPPAHPAATAVATAARSPPLPSSLPPPPSYAQPAVATVASSSSRRGSTSQPPVEQSYFSPTHHTLFSDTPVVAPQQTRPTTPLQRSSEMVAASRNRSGAPSRPSSRASNRTSNGASRRPALQSTQSCTSRLEQNTAEASDLEDGPRPKRARVTQTDWNGSSAFGTGGESLRVTAAAAASIRGHRPYIGAFLTSDIAANELGERPPTPRPTSKRLRIGKEMDRPPTSDLNLRRPVSNATRGGVSPSSHYQPSRNNDPLGILADSSPEKLDQSSVDSSPMDLPSSPPILRSPSPPQRTSLGASNFNDSGFASCAMDEYSPEQGQFKREDDAEELGLARLPSATFAADLPSLQAETLGRKILPAPPGYVPPSSPLPAPRKRAPRSRTNSMSRGPAKGKSALAHDQTEMMLSTALIDGDRLRSESCLTDGGSINGDAAPTLRRSKSNVMHERKKQMIQDKLDASVKAGQMPRFCKNCGEIKTPSWRKAFMKIVAGAPENVPAASTENETYGYEVLERDADENIVGYRICKPNMHPGDEGYDEIELCNPCGIWLSRNKIMRPMEAWLDKGLPKPKQRSLGPRKRKSSTNDPLSDAAQSDAVQSDLPPVDSIEHDADGDEPQAQAAPTAATNKRPGIAAPFKRANSAGPMGSTPKGQKKNNLSAQIALQRAIQSSPPRFPGSKHTPIEIDADTLSPGKPTKRILFPSPRKPGQFKSLDQEFERNASSNVQIAAVQTQGQHFGDSVDKENQTLADTASDDDCPLSSFGTQSAAPVTPQKRCPTQGAKLLKTPLRSASKRTPLTARASGHTRSHSNPATPSRSMIPGGLLSPQQMTPFTAQLYGLLSDSNQRDNDDFFGTATGDDGGLFHFSDFNTSDPNNANFNLFEDHTSGAFWTSEGALDDSIESFMNDNQSPGGGVNTPAA